MNNILIGFIFGLFAGLYLNISRTMNGVSFKIKVNGLKGKIKVISTSHKKALLTVIPKETDADIKKKQADEIYEDTYKRFKKNQ